MTSPALVVRSGSIIALRLFDIAYAIDLPQVERLWSAHSQVTTSRGQLAYTPSKAVAFDVPPVSLTLDSTLLDLGTGTPLTALVSARIYDFGVVSLSVRVPVEHTHWSEFARLVTATNQTVGPGAPDAFWTDLLSRITAPLAPAFVRQNRSGLQEDYLFAVVKQWDEPVSADQLMERVDLAALLTDESRPLSEGARRDLLRQRFSYYTDDLVVMTWDRAFIVEPRGDSDVIDVLEVANAQLLEMRYYDELLDDELPRMNEWVRDVRTGSLLRSPRRYASLARRLYGLVAEVTELTERVDNALQVTEDVYLARVYASALDLMRVPKLSAAVDRKLAIIRDTYTALYDEASARRSELLEMTIVLLIVLEIVLALFHV
ncbi:hypothetical protein DFR24_1225 [Panacagrimonas perspica]|uniref:DUF155 domain-containing protein n=1 Tax=Panacagrimonas perspica TaxID=381431 RepID=A0A4R7PDL7_9GAMM|nr:hypothetical protein [Panacagrimonas perspica]TDU31842.1 hypothetical protein DFR24_1225 [Panacagrimonas perspica]THD02954.1 hypothetical protein B1810_10115 [Panacagrimonas perspica]